MEIVWYKTLTIDQKINLKSWYFTICGVRWEDLNALFNIKHKIIMVYNKLKQEGFDI